MARLVHRSGRSVLRIWGRDIALPRSKSIRILVGVGLVVGGLLGFLPVLGYWMLPLGLLVLSADLPMARRLVTWLVYQLAALRRRLR
jgi:hypothetical protein